MKISIDIGTSYSTACALLQNDKPSPIDISTGSSFFGDKHSLPSAVYVDETGKILVGQAAVNSQRIKPENFCKEFKRSLGQSFPIQLGSKSFLPEDLYTELFKHIKSKIEKISSEPIEEAYLTCPATYGADMRLKIQEAAKKAGLFNTELVDEPVAAALSYLKDGFIQNNQTLLVYDFGGGTFDAAVLKYENGDFTLLEEPCGIEHCGGVDIDRLIYKDLLAKVDETTIKELKEKPTNFMRFSDQLIELAIKAKEYLSEAQIFKDNITAGFDYIPYELSREAFEQMAAPLISQTIPICRSLLEKANVKPSDLSAVLLVGGSSRIPLVEQMVKKLADKTAVYCVPDRELCVAMGALYCGQLKKEKEAAEAQKQAALQNENISKRSQQKLKEAEEVMANTNLYSNAEVLDALSVLNAAAETGNAGAQKNLGTYYFFGRGVSKSYSQAVKWFRKAAEQGDADAQYYLGLCYEQGKDISQSPTEAFKWYKKAAEQNLSVAQYALGKCFYNGLGTVKAPNEAFFWYKKAAEQGLPEAQYSVGLCLQNAKGVEQNTKEALKYLTKSAEQGFASAQYTLGQHLEQNEKYTEALKWYKKAAEQDNPNALAALGVMYYSGLGAEQSFYKAVDVSKKAASLGSFRALNTLGLCYYNGQGVEQSDIDAVECFKIAALNDFADSQFYLGTCYASGRGEPVQTAFARNTDSGFIQGVKGFFSNLISRFSNEQNKKEISSEQAATINARGIRQSYTEAVKWYRKAAVQGHVRAQLELGNCCYNGQGTEQSYFEAARWYRKLAEQGFAEAQYKLGYCCRFGLGVEQSATEAAKWYRKAAEQGHAASQFFLGVLCSFANKENKEQGNNTEAVKWYKLAAQQGLPEAQFNLALIYSEDGNDSEAVKWYKQAAEHGLPEAQFNLALICSKGGRSTEVNKWLFEAANKGLLEAHNNYGVLNKSFSSSVEFAARNGLKEAQYNLGLWYSKKPPAANSTEATRSANFAEAERWLNNAANRGLPEAQLAYGLLKLATSSDFGDAEQWLIKAANQGSARAQFELGISDNSKAADYLEMAAKQNLPEAQYCLGLMYKKGRGKEQSDSLAAAWFQEAAEQNHPEACYEAAEAYKRLAVYKEAIELYRRAAQLGCNRANLSLFKLSLTVSEADIHEPTLSEGIICLFKWLGNCSINLFKCNINLFKCIINLFEWFGNSIINLFEWFGKGFGHKVSGGEKTQISELLKIKSASARLAELEGMPYLMACDIKKPFVAFKTYDNSPQIKPAPHKDISTEKVSPGAYSSPQNKINYDTNNGCSNGLAIFIGALIFLSMKSCN